MSPVDPPSPDPAPTVVVTEADREVARDWLENTMPWRDEMLFGLGEVIARVRTESERIGAERERAKVAKWLRNRWIDIGAPVAARSLPDLEMAKSIEAGEHDTEAGR